MKTMTLDEVKKLPPLTKEEIDAAMNFKNADFSDCPVMTKEELKEFRPWYEVHPDWVKMKKGDRYGDLCERSFLQYFLVLLPSSPRVHQRR